MLCIVARAGNSCHSQHPTPQGLGAVAHTNAGSILSTSQTFGGLEANVGRKSKREGRAQERRLETGVKLLVLGGGLVLVPLFMGGSMLGKMFANLIPIGLLMLAIGGGFLWWARQAKASGLPPVRREPFEGHSRAAPPVRQDWTPPDRPLERRIKPSFEAPPERVAPRVWSREVFEVIEWRRFEAVIEALFQQAGFETKTQSHGADQGVDVWLYSKHQPGEPVSIVQCKHWQGKQVGVDKIRELRGVMAAHNVRRGQFATTSTFSSAAVEFATGNAINLLDISGLLALIDKRSADEQARLLAIALHGDYWRPTCVNCGDKMVEREPKKGGAPLWGCVNFPRCKTTMRL
jgi:restriction system protein